MQIQLTNEARFGLFLTLFFGLGLSSANAQVNFAKVDSIAEHYSETYETTTELAQGLTATLHTDQEKARVLYMWIAHNVRYDCRKYHNRTADPRIVAYTKAELQEKIRAREAKLAEKTMKGKRGICGDYSRLYKAFCDAVGLEAVIIRGNARDFYKPYRNAHDNPHAWNAVKVEGQWQLLDATWGAGYTDAGVTKFSRNVSAGYFAVSPALFAQNHFPDDVQWQLLDQPLGKKDFPNQPMINFRQSKYGIKNFASQAVLSTRKKKEKKVWLEFEQVPKALMVTNRKGKPIKFQKAIEGDKIILSFPSGAARSIVVYGGKSLRSRMNWLARYEL